MGALLAAAEAIAREAHAEAVCKAGRPYIEHVLRVSAAGKTEAERVVGMLHDVFEDGTDEDRARARAAMPPEIIEAVLIVTRPKSEPHKVYYERIVEAANPVALAVKLADLKDHLREPEWINERMIRGYKRAYAKLWNAAFGIAHGAAIY